MICPGTVGGRGWLPEELLESIKSSRVMQNLHWIWDALSPASRGRRIFGTPPLPPTSDFGACVFGFLGCRFVGLCICGFGVHMLVFLFCGCKVSWVCRFMGLWVCGFVGLWVCVCVCLRLCIFVCVCVRVCVCVCVCFACLCVFVRLCVYVIVWSCDCVLVVCGLVCVCLSCVMC